MGRLSHPFLGPGDNFSKSCDENQIWSKCACARARLMRRSQVPYSCCTIQICFRHNFSEKISPGPKNGLERRVSRFSTACAKNQVLKYNIDKVTVIRVPQITLPGASPLCMSFEPPVTAGTAVYLKDTLCSGISHDTMVRYGGVHGRTKIRSVPSVVLNLVF